MMNPYSRGQGSGSGSFGSSPFRVSGTTSFQGLDNCAIFSWDWIAGEVAGRKARVEIWVATMTTVVGVDGDVQEENTKMGGSVTPPQKNCWAG